MYVYMDATFYAAGAGKQLPICPSTCPKPLDLVMIMVRTLLEILESSCILSHCPGPIIELPPTYYLINPTQPLLSKRPDLLLCSSPYKGTFRQVI